MILHSVSFRWHPEVTAEQVDALTAALSQLPAQIPVLVSYHYGPDLGLREGNADYAVIALLQNPEDVDTYVDHPAHVELSRQHTQVMAASRSAVQFALPENAVLDP